MLLIPYDTDAPIYHLPFATIALIFANTIIFAFTFFLAPSQVEPWFLTWGDGWHPVQWFSSMFLHAGVIHLVGNMLCLWGFGLVVEGKLGWWKFLLAYLMVGGVQSMVEQTIMLNATEGGALGASGAIFGLMAMTVVWAPLNSIIGVVLVGWVPFPFKCSIIRVALLALALQVLLQVVVTMNANVPHTAMTSQLLHLIGAAAGFGVGGVMVITGLVNCEKGDLFSVLSGKHEIHRVDDSEELRRNVAHERKRDQHHGSALESIRQWIDEGNAEAAYSKHCDMAHYTQTWTFPDADFLNLIQLFHTQKKWTESIAPMRDYIRGRRSNEAQVRLRLALSLRIAPARHSPF